MRKQIRGSFGSFYDALRDVIEGFLRWVRLDHGQPDITHYCSPASCPEEQEVRLQTVVNAAFGGHGTVTMPLQPFLDLQFEVNAGTGSGVIEKAHDLVRSVEFPSASGTEVFPETPVPTLKRVLSADDVVIGNTIIYRWSNKWEVSVVRSKHTFGWDFDRDPMYVVPQLSIAPHVLKEDELPKTEHGQYVPPLNSEAIPTPIREFIADEIAQALCTGDCSDFCKGSAAAQEVVLEGFKP